MNTLGLSGCKIVKINDYTIRKISGCKSYNNRLNEQSDKQQFFDKFISSDNIYTPKFYQSGMVDDKFYFDMEYIPGLTFDKYLSYASQDDLYKLGWLLSKYLSKMIVSTSRMYPEKMLYNNIIKKIDQLKLKSEYVEFLDYIKYALDFIELDDQVRGFCHGDLTFSNILFVDDKVYFIDFLDSYINSPLIDLIKLKQDLYYKWSINRIVTNDRIRISQSFSFLWKILEEDWQHLVQTDIFNILEALNFLRIEPYVSGNDKIRLDQIIKELCLYEDFNSPNGRFNTVRK